MSSSEGEEPFQSAQLPQDQVFVQNDALDDSSVDSPDPNASNDGDPVGSVLQKDVALTALDRAGSETAAKRSEEAKTTSEEGLPAPDSRRTHPNKYEGPPSTWRTWTAPERDLAASLDQLAAKDLSIHLYNALMLKKAHGTRDQSRVIERPDAEGGVPDEFDDWVPPKVWTAWPLPPESVPREDDEGRWEDGTSLPKDCSVKGVGSSELLGEMLVAQIMRRARKQFDDRESEDQDSEASGVRSMKCASDPPSKENTNDNALEMKPVVMADDERASQILQPTIRHVLTKVDNLLMGLHHARTSYLTIENATSDSGGDAGGRSESRRTVRKRKRSTSAGDLDVAMTSDDASAASEFENASSSRAISRIKSQSKRPKSTSSHTSNRNLQNRKSRMGCRDWSDVLGVASMTGWPPSVVERAAARCASLFGEGILFRTLREGSPAFVERSYLPNIPQPAAVTRHNRSVVSKEIAGSGSRGKGMVGGVHADGFLQPIQGKKSWKYSKKKTKPRSVSQESDG